MSYQHKRILIVRLSAIGDVVRTLPALKTLRKRFPSAYIAWVVEEKAKDVLERHPELDAVIVFPRGRWEHVLSHPSSLPAAVRELFSFLRRLRSDRFDIALDFHGILKSGLITRLSRARDRAGFSRQDVKEFNHLFTNHKVTLPCGRLPRIERNLALIRHLVADEECTDAEIGISEEDTARAEAFFRQNVPQGKKVAAIHAGASRPLKRWPEEHFHALAEELAERDGIFPIFIGGPSDKRTIESVRSRMHSASAAAIPSTLSELADLVSRCDLFISADTGPMHIASVMGTPVVAIFGPTDPIVHSPYRQPFVVVTKNLPCSPCDERDCVVPKCMNSITPQEVLEQAERLLQLHSIQRE